LNFRKDELVFLSTSEDDCADTDREEQTLEDTFLDKEHHIPNVNNTEEASEMVDSIEGRVDKM
tara:strand:+ start:246 stop:434 length:189 start_codon:yes stop_codon:yes gene_type:complete